MSCRRLLLLALLLVPIAAPASAHAFRLPVVLAPQADNPADALSHLPLDDVEYDGARRCDPKPKPGVTRMTRWLQRNASGQFWGAYRCERWGRGEASLHAENRAIDWHLNVYDPRDYRAARKLIRLLLAPDRAGNPQALARRMGVEELIWDCSYWAAGMDQFRPYSACLNKHGDVRRHVNRTVAHRDHVHIGMSKAGAAARTTFWRRR